MLTLEQLNAKFLKRTSSHSFKNVDTIAEADGVQFLCPKCFVANKGAIGTHSVICWSPSVPQDTQPTPGRWSLIGTGIKDLTLQAGSSSVQLTSGCGAHFFVQCGEIKPC